MSAAVRAWIALACLLPAGASAAVQADAGAATSEQADLAGPPTSVGIEGRAHFVHARDDLDLRPGSERATVLARLVQRGPGPPGLTRYELRYVAVRPGLHDLAELVVDREGERPPDLASIPVRVDSLLPEGHRGELAELGRPPSRLQGHFVAITALLAALWVLPLLLLWLRRARARPVAAPPPTPPPSLADQLRPLVEALVAGTATRAEQARLERLLLAHWSRRLGLDASRPAAALAHLRQHDEAGALLRALEGFLHARSDARDAPQDLADLLAPYGREARIDEESMQGVR